MIKRVIAVALSAFLLAALVATWLGARQQSRALVRQQVALYGAAMMSAQPTVADVDALPPPVGRYLRWAMPEMPAMKLIRMTQTGKLRTDASSERWMPFEADHLVAPAAPAFLWSARVTMVPLVHVRVRDALMSGRGAGSVALFSAFTVADDANTDEMNSGSLHRFLAEAVWYPTALLPSARLQWSPIDDRSAMATLTDHNIAVSLEFRFAETGEVTGIYTPARWGSFDGGYQQRPWEGHFRRYELMDGVRVPSEADVGWYVGDEWHAVWEGTLVGYEVEQPGDPRPTRPARPPADR